MTTPAEILMGILAAANIGSVGSGNDSDWRLGTGALLDSPDQQIVVADTPGERPDPKWLLDYPYVQVMIRGSKDGYQAAFGKVKDCYDKLLGISPVTGAWGRIDGITGASTPSFIGNDKLARPMFVANLRLIFEPATSALTNRLPL